MKKSIKRSSITIFAIGIFIFLLHIFSMLTFDRSIEYKTEYFKSNQLSKELSGYRIAFITDTHSMTRKDYIEVAEELNKRSIDLLLLGGDIANSGCDPRPAIEELSRIRTSDGIYGVEGNHDNYLKLFSAMEENGITPLSNSGNYIRDHFYVAGIEDLWKRNSDIDVATSEADEGDLVILLAHNPDVSMHQSTSKIDLILSGHTHGGQITFLGLWAPDLTLRRTITKYGQRFMSGWCENEEGTPVYVSRGTGYLDKIPRIFARPQVIIFELSAE